MGLGMFFGFFAYYRGDQPGADNHIFDLMVQRTYGAMTNDVLISIPLFRADGICDGARRAGRQDVLQHPARIPPRAGVASAVATLIVCTFWGIASGLVGAVVVLMGVIAFNPMLKAGYDVRLASGVITAGGTLGILIPPSVMIIVYAPSRDNRSSSSMRLRCFRASSWRSCISSTSSAGRCSIRRSPRNCRPRKPGCQCDHGSSNYSRRIRARCCLRLLTAVAAAAKAMQITADGAR